MFLRETFLLSYEIELYYLSQALLLLCITRISYMNLFPLNSRNLAFWKRASWQSSMLYRKINILGMSSCFPKAKEAHMHIGKRYMWRMSPLAAVKSTEQPYYHVPHSSICFKCKSSLQSGNFASGC